MRTIKSIVQQNTIIHYSSNLKATRLKSSSEPLFTCMEGEIIAWRGRELYLLVFVVLVAYSRVVFTESGPDEVVTCICPGGNYMKIKVSQCRVGKIRQVCKESDESKLCCQVLPHCTEDGNREQIEGG